jgi:hypothetical protein
VTRVSDAAVGVRRDVHPGAASTPDVPAPAAPAPATHAAVVIPGGDETSECPGPGGDDVTIARPRAPSFEVVLPAGSTALRLRSRSAGDHALVAVREREDSPESCSPSADHAASLDLRGAQGGARYRVFVASVDGSRAPVAVTWTTDGGELAAPVEPAVAAPASDEVRGAFVLSRVPHDEERVRLALGLTGAVTRTVPVPGDWFGRCHGDWSALPGFTCTQGGSSSLSLRSRRGRWEMVVRAQTDGACPDGDGGVGECPADTRVIGRFELPAGLRLVTDPRGSLRRDR